MIFDAFTVHCACAEACTEHDLQNKEKKRGVQYSLIEINW